MAFEPRDLIQIAVLLLTAGKMYATLKSESRHQSAQHAELKDATEAQAAEIGRRIDKLRGTIENVVGDSREHKAQIESLDRRVTRNEQHIDDHLAVRRA